MIRITRTVLFLLLSNLLAAASIAKDYDVLQIPAKPSAQATDALVYTVRTFNGRAFATGQSGHILISDDNGASWQQSKVPVSSAIVDIYFATAEKGWAVGHEGVILHSSDAGKTWQKQYDGLRFGTEGLSYYQGLQEQEPDNTLFSGLAEEMEFSIGQGADKPFFKIYFSDEQNGYALGAYGMSVATTDGGKTWQHNMHRLDNDSLYHVFDITQAASDDTLLLCGEAGLLMLVDLKTHTAKQIPSSPWDGSFFSCSNNQGTLVIAGLRGRIFYSADNGQTWAESSKPASSSIVDTLSLADGRLLAAGIGGEVLVSSDKGASFEFMPVKTGSRIYGMAMTNEQLLIASPAGIKQFNTQQ